MKTAVIQEDSIYIVGAGAQTPVGRSVLAAAAAVRCNVAAFSEHPFMIDEDGDPMVVARATWLAEDLPVADRIVALAADAAEEALCPLAGQLSTVQHQIRLHLALSAENLPGAAQRRTVLDQIATRLGLTSPDARLEPVVGGHAGGLLALENAVRQLRRGEASLCLVGGADSWLAPEMLEHIDSSGSLHSLNNSWGFTPGEGAGFCLITTGASARRLGLSPLAELLTVATTLETKLLGTKTICLGEGLTAAFRAVLDPAQPVSHSYCDFNGETYRADEYGFAVCRTSECFEDASRFTAAAECWGDVGAASGVLALTLPVAAAARGYARGAVNLVWSSGARGPLRGAALVSTSKSLGA